MHVLPPVIIPGGGRFKATSTGGVLVSVRGQGPEWEKQDDDVVIRWRISMSPCGRSNADNGPTIEGRIPARDHTMFEECYRFMPGSIGFRRADSWSNGQFNFEFGVPGTYRVLAWVEREGRSVSLTQTCVFEIIQLSSSPSPAVSLG